MVKKLSLLNGGFKDEKKVFLVGSPNVGKSAVFNALTGSYVTVSNYPGTTVDISMGKIRVGSHYQITVLDTPGMYSLRPITEEENVTRQLILKQRPDCILHVVDAKNLERMLPLTIQLIETGLPVILVLNLYDELLERGMQLHIAHLEHDLGIPVVKTVAVRGIGIDNLSSRIVEVIDKRYDFKPFRKKYSGVIENLAAVIEAMLEGDYKVNKRLLALLLMQNDAGTFELVKNEKRIEEIKKVVAEISSQEIAYMLSQERQEAARAIALERIEVDRQMRQAKWRTALSDLMIHPFWGMMILGAVLWFGLFKFVGEFGAGTLVDFIETRVFEAGINPWVDRIFGALFGSGILFHLFAGEYGVFTLGLRYAIAIILPIVGTFFIVFSIIEDTGYLPRLAMLVDRVFKKIGLSGRALIPLTLGFGCDTMATIVTRTLETKKERIIATILLTLAIPCSAQLGVLLGLLGGKPIMTTIWAVTVILVFMLSGFLSKILIKGEEASFFMEMPPLRMPNPVHVFIKTYSRMIWYLKEVIPLFILASVMIWIGKITGLFEFLVGLMRYPVQWTGMPADAAPAFLYGFFRRDFGAAGLFDLAKSGALAGNSLLVAAVVLTLFVPCVAQFIVTWKERGRMMAVGMAAFIFPFAFFVGFVLNIILKVCGVQL